MTKTVVFISNSGSCSSIDEQRSACVSHGDLVIEQGERERSFGELDNKLKKIGKGFAAGDRLRLYDLGHLNVTTMTLIRVLRKLLQSGVTIEVVKPGLTIEPGTRSPAGLLLDELISHQRISQGSRVSETAAKAGRKPVLQLEQLPMIRAMMAKPGATSASVASELGIARSTLFKYLQASQPPSKTDEPAKRREASGVSTTSARASMSLSDSVVKVPASTMDKRSGAK